MLRCWVTLSELLVVDESLRMISTGFNKTISKKIQEI